MLKPRKKVNIWVSILVILLGFGIIGGFIFYAFQRNADVVQNFVRQHRSSGQLLYDEVFSFDLAEDYPQTPEEIMQLYSAITLLLYGGMIINDDLYVDILQQLRGILSNDLIEHIPLEIQLAHLQESLSVLGEVGALPRRPQVLHIRRETEDRALAHVRQFIMYYEHVYWIYLLERDENEHWKIMSWVRTDSTFTETVE